MTPRAILVVVGIAALAAMAPAIAAGTPPQTLESFDVRLKDYLALKNKAEHGLPHLTKQSTPEEVVRHQRALAAQIKEARPGAKAGWFFTPQIEALVKRTMTEVLSGADGPSVRDSILDENPDVKTIALHEQYPPAVPVSTMPPQVLAALPKLPKGLEYRFLGTRLVLLDTDADMVVDYTGAVFTP
ncbi:MAG TPA: hypothetical protein VGS03_19320 [Candidatus Polarisedimenticolia bacterium]|nr:hypothetical protein [Candidatus Polarisedimenticolia bacterium]